MSGDVGCITCYQIGRRRTHSASFFCVNSRNTAGFKKEWSSIGFQSQLILLNRNLHRLRRSHPEGESARLRELFVDKNPINLSIEKTCYPADEQDDAYVGVRVVGATVGSLTLCPRPFPLLH